MADSPILAQGSSTFLGGMDTSRSPWEIDEGQYSRATNLVVPRSLGGIRVRPGFCHQRIIFDSIEAEEVFKKGVFQGEGWFLDKRTRFLVAVVDGVAFRMKRVGGSAFEATAINFYDRQNSSTNDCWITRIPDGVIVNNGINNPLVIKANASFRTDPSKDQIGPGCMGVYVQNRFFYVTPSKSIILVSNFLDPISVTEMRLFGVGGFTPPENNDEITAIGRQKVMLDYAEGGALLFSTRGNIYSVDVRGGMDTWGTQGNRLGKVSETIAGIGAVSPYSFEPFGTNVYFRNHAFGISDLRQSQYQFNNLDSTISESIEASYWMDSDTDWMLTQCYTRAWRSRLFTTVSPERDDAGRYLWNGVLSYHPSAIYQNQNTIPRRYESVFTGLRVVAMTTTYLAGYQDDLYLWSFDKDGSNRLYMLDDQIDFDLNHNGERIEIEGWIEFKAMNFNQPYQFKKTQDAFISFRDAPRGYLINIYQRTDSGGEWLHYANYEAKISSNKFPQNTFDPNRNPQPQNRSFIYLPKENVEKCSRTGYSYITIQDRLEFKGPIHISHFIRTANQHNPSRSVTESDKDPILLSYSYRPDYGYQIATNLS